jgi:hypothetical protein
VSVLAVWTFRPVRTFPAGGRRSILPCPRRGSRTMGFQSMRRPAGPSGPVLAALRAGPDGCRSSAQGLRVSGWGDGSALDVNVVDGWCFVGASPGPFHRQTGYSRKPPRSHGPSPAMDMEHPALDARCPEAELRQPSETARSAAKTASDGPAGRRMDWNPMVRDPRRGHGRIDLRPPAGKVRTGRKVQTSDRYERLSSIQSVEEDLAVLSRRWCPPRPPGPGAWRASPDRGAGGGGRPAGVPG